MKILKINISDLFYSILLFFLFEPNIFVKISLLNNIYVLGAIFSFAYALIIHLKKRIPLSKLLILLAVWRMIAIFSTIIAKNGDILKCGYQSLIFITLFMYAEIFKKANKFDVFLKKLIEIFFVYLFINILTYIFYPNGLYDTGTHTRLYFLGIRTRFTEYAFTAILLALLNFKIKNINFRNTAILIIICLLNIVIPKIGTAIIGIILFLISYMVLAKVFVGKENYSFKSLFFCSMLMLILVVFFRIQNIFEFIIVDLLHKNLTLTNRVYIWDNAYSFIMNGNLLIGNGYVNDGNFISYGTRIWQAHNQLLQLLYEVGILGTGIFYYFILKSFPKIKRKIKDIDILIISFMFTFLIMMITEIYSYYIPFYVVVICSYYKDTINECIERKT